MSGRQLQARFSRLFNQLLDPGLCLGCAHGLDGSEKFCAECTRLLKRIANPCQGCGLENPGDNPLCAACLHHPPRWQRMVAPLDYQGLARDLLLQLKFSESLHLANGLVSAVLDAFDTISPAPEVLIPVPLHHNRLLDRGYNQAYEIARTLSHWLDIPVDTRALTRIHHTDSQSGLSADKRRKNVIGAFSYRPGKPYSHIAVIDDIITTGSTAHEITRTLHRGGCLQVEIWGLGRVINH